MQEELKQQMRAEFEAWHRKENGATDEMFVLRDDGHYAWGRTCDMFAAFQVAWNRRTPVSGEVADGVASLTKYERCVRGWNGDAPWPVEDFYAASDVDALLASGAQGIDHAKLDEGELAAFESWALSDDGNCSRADLMKWSPKDRQAQVGETYCCDLVERDWRVWQARGQQAGGAEE